MQTIHQFRNLALAFEEVYEEPHFEKVSFRIRKKIFATLDVDSQIVVLKLPLIHHSVFHEMDADMVYPVEGAWGKQGWTKVSLKLVSKNILQQQLILAYCMVAPKKLCVKYDNISNTEYRIA